MSAAHLVIYRLVQWVTKIKIKLNCVKDARMADMKKKPFTRAFGKCQIK